MFIENELEASLMLSKPPSSHSHHHSHNDSDTSIPPSRRGIVLTLLTHTRNPSTLARALYRSPSSVPHTMLSGAAAEELGATLGVSMVDPGYYFTEARWREHRRGLGLPEEPVPYPDRGGDDRGAGDEPGISDKQDYPPLDQLPTGTVGAVALDARGCIAAATSTGGRTNKLVGRIGDTPSMGSGFWAEEWRASDADYKGRGWRGLLRRIMRIGRKGGEDEGRGGEGMRAMGVSGTGDGDVRP